MFGVFTTCLFFYDVYTDISVNVTLRRNQAGEVWIALSTIFLVLPYLVTFVLLMNVVSPVFFAFIKKGAFSREKKYIDLL